MADIGALGSLNGGLGGTTPASVIQIPNPAQPDNFGYSVEAGFSLKTHNIPIKPAAVTPTVAFLRGIKGGKTYPRLVTAPRYPGQLPVPPGAPEPEPGPGAAPTVSAITPATVDPDEPVQVSVTFTNGMRRVVIWAKFGVQDSPELVYDGTAFTGYYVGYSARQSINDGYRYIIRRYPYWPVNVTITVVATDQAGLETVRSS